MPPSRCEGECICPLRSTVVVLESGGFIRKERLGWLVSHPRKWDKLVAIYFLNEVSVLTGVVAYFTAKGNRGFHSWPEPRPTVRETKRGIWERGKNITS